MAIFVCLLMKRHLKEAISYKNAFIEKGISDIVVVCEVYKDCSCVWEES